MFLCLGDTHSNRPLLWSHRVMYCNWITDFLFFIVFLTLLPFLRPSYPDKEIGAWSGFHVKCQGRQEKQPEQIYIANGILKASHGKHCDWQFVKQPRNRPLWENSADKNHLFSSSFGCVTKAHYLALEKQKERIGCLNCHWLCGA